MTWKDSINIIYVQIINVISQKYLLLLNLFTYEAVIIYKSTYWFFGLLDYCALKYTYQPTSEHFQLLLCSIPKYQKKKKTTFNDPTITQAYNLIGQQNFKISLEDFLIKTVIKMPLLHVLILFPHEEKSIKFV